MSESVASVTNVERPPLEARIALTRDRLRRLAVTAQTPAARKAAASGALQLEVLATDPSLVQRRMERRFVRAVTVADLWFAGHIARIFGLALSIDGWPHRGGVDWGGSPELLEQARTFAHEYLPGFQKAMGEAAANYLNEVLPIDVTVVN